MGLHETNKEWGELGRLGESKKRGLGGLRDWEAASSPALDSSVVSVPTISDVLALVALVPVALARLALVPVALACLLASSACCWGREKGLGSAKRLGCPIRLGGPRDWGAQSDWEGQEIGVHNRLGGTRVGKSRIGRQLTRSASLFCSLRKAAAFLFAHAVRATCRLTSFCLSE